MLLASLAYQMMLDHVSDLPADRVLEILGPQLGALLRVGHRRGVPRRRRPQRAAGRAARGRYAFTHLTFQEYLAARHVSANPDLVKSLADNVDDPWWHETILLYAATADASPIVRACLDSGTIPALTLAFDCAEASTEIDPGPAAAPGPRTPAGHTSRTASPEHRRLIAGVLAARLVRQTRHHRRRRQDLRPARPRRPVLALPRRHAGAPARRPVRPRRRPARHRHLGSRGAGLRQLAELDHRDRHRASRSGSRTDDELQEQAVTGALARQLPASVTSAWTQPAPRRPAAPGLWLRPGQPHPHELTGAAIRPGGRRRRAGTPPCCRRYSPRRSSTSPSSIIRDLDDIRALSGALARDLAARANSDGRAVDLMHAHAHAIVLTYAHALDLTRADAIAPPAAPPPTLIGGLDLSRTRAPWPTPSPATWPAPSSSPAPARSSSRRPSTRT